MGKNLDQRERGIAMDERNPGCIKGIFHHFPYHKRHRANKRLTQRKHGAENLALVIADEESTKSTPEAAQIQENNDSVIENSAVEAKLMDPPSPAPKSSITSRIKALITEEMSKRRGRHRRSSSYPIRTQLERTSSIHHLEASDVDLSDHTKYSNNEVLGCNDSVHSIASLDLPKVRANYLKQSTINKLRDHTLLEDEFIYAIEPSKYASLQESKLFLDALDLLNMRKEVFLKILKDPSSSLAHQLHSRRSSSLKFGLTKSVSFPSPGSSDLRSNSITKNENGYCQKEEHELKDSYQENGSPKKLTKELELSCNASSSSSPSPSSSDMLKKRNDNKVALKSFKNLREKIKHVIRERKKEKRRIIMDAVLHKIPYGRRSSKDNKKDSQEFGKYPPSEKDQMNHQFKRTSSFNESFDRYDQLLETSYGKEAKFPLSERVKSGTANNTVSPTPRSHATLGRILSLPDLRSYSYFPIDESPSTSSVDTLARDASGNSRLTEKKLLGLNSDNKMQHFPISESESQENFVDVGENFDDTKTEETASYYDLSLEPGLNSAPHSSKPEIVEDDKNDSLDLYNISKQSKVKQFYSDLLHQVDIKNKAEFSYVKDVLELSGFSGNEILGKWHSAEHPVNPLVFDEVEGCLVAQPDCSGYEEGGSCDHLLLFDLINEVLLNIYERSFCYWPMPLTVRSHIHRMPMGYRVLEEVWGEISLFLSWKPDIDLSIDDAVSRDLGKGDVWMNLQFDGECVGLEVEDLIFDDLLEEIISN